MKYIAPVLALSLALTMPMSASTYSDDTSVLYSINLPLTVYTFVFSSSTTRYGPYTLSPGTSGSYGTAAQGNAGGYTVVLPPSDVEGYYILSGTTTTASKGYGRLPGYYFLDSNIDYEYSGSPSTGTTPTLSTSTFNGIIFVPAHSSNLYLHIFISTRDISYSAGNASFGISYNNPSLVFYPSSMSPDYTSLFNQVIAGITSLESALSKIEEATTQLSPMGQFEADYLDHYQDQLQGVEGALSGDSSSSLGGLAPNGGDYVGFAEDLTDGFGFSSSHFSPSQFSDAINSLSGTDAFDVGGPWEFFSQSIADALAGQGNSTYSMSGLPPDDFILDWVRDSEIRRGKW